MVFDAYAQSSLFQKLLRRKNLRRPLRLAFLDIDHTLTGSQKTTNTTRKKLEEQGYVIVYVTARTEEMLMSSTQYALSKSLGFSRPEPKLGSYQGKYVYLPPEQIEPAGILDPDIIAGSTGTQILLRQKSGGFLKDYHFEESFKETSQSWRKKCMTLVALYNTPQKQAFPAAYETPANYLDGLTNVYQPKYRIALSFQSAKQKTAFRKFVRDMQKKIADFWNISLTDDSDPKKELHILCLTPKNGSKTKAVDHIINLTTNKLALQRSDLQVLIAGDGHADFDMGMKAARGTCVTFLLAGGSRLMPALRCENEHPDLLDEELENLKIYLISSKTKGFYSNELYANRNMIICDEVDKDKKEASSILSLIEEMEMN